MMGFEHLWYAEAVARLSDAEKMLEQAGRAAAQAQDSELFKQLHEKRMELWDLIKKVMQKAGGSA